MDETLNRNGSEADRVELKSHAEPAKALHRVGLESRTLLTVPHFGVLSEILARTDLAAIFSRAT